jgi:hypothetical protein
MDTAGSFFSTGGAAFAEPLATPVKAACTEWISAGNSLIGRELLATKAATISAASSIDFEGSGSDVVMGQFLE